MNVYPISQLLELAHSPDIQTYSCLDTFYRSYSKLIKEDKSAPLFSKTSKYSSFPVRCQWKKGDVKRMKKKEEKEWRKDDIAPTKIQKIEGIRGAIIRILNKITKDCFEVHSNELLTVLTEAKDPESVRIVAEVILEKVWYDKSFYHLYVSLCQKLWQSKEWMSSAYKIVHKQQYFYSTTMNGTSATATATATATLHGPYHTQADAIKEAESKTHLRKVFLALCRDNFLQREKWIKEYHDLPNDTSNKKYRLKRKLFGTVEIMGQFFSMNLLSENVIHALLYSLLHQGQGAMYEEEIEAFHLLWMLVVDQLSEKNKEVYKPFLKKEHEKPWSARTSFMIQDIYDTISCQSLKKKEVKKEEIKREDPVKISRCLDATLDTIKKTDLLAILRDAIEYHEYLPAHIRTIKFINPEQSDFEEAISRAGEDIADLQVDAPKALQNMATLLSELSYETLMICYNPSKEEEQEEEQKKAWEKIIEKIDKKIVLT